MSFSIKRKSETISSSPSSSSAPSPAASSPSPSASEKRQRTIDFPISKQPISTPDASSTMASSLSSTKPSAEKKKLTIHGFKVAPKKVDAFEETTWIKLQTSIRDIFAQKATELGLESLYKAVDDVGVLFQFPALFPKLRTECEERIHDKVLQLSNESQDPATFLALVDSVWRSFQEQMKSVRMIFLALERKYLIPTGATGPMGASSIRTLWDLGLSIFRENLSHMAEVQEKIVSALLLHIEQERTGNMVDKILLQSLIRMFIALGTYHDVFERRFLSETAKFYQTEGLRLINTLDVPEYLRHVERRLKEEADRTVHYLDSSTRKQLVSQVEKQLIEAHIKPLLDKGFVKLMDENRVDDVSRLYSLFSMVNAQDPLRREFSDYCKKRGVSLVTDEQRDATMVTDLLEFKARMDQILERSFVKNELFLNTLKDAFESFINQRQNKPAELIAKFIDNLLRSGSKGSSEDDQEQTMDRVLILFRFISGKDVFEAFYKKDLAKRLLLGKSASIDAEKSMIARLKTECGSTFTNKLEGMFKDIDLSRELMNAFRISKESKRSAAIEIHVNVLTTGYWPPYTPAEIKLPKEVHDIQDAFKTFYLGKHTGRRLVWQNSLGHATIRASFPKGKRELDVSIYQAVVLMLFNESDTLSLQDIATNSGIEDKELRRTLLSLACGKVRVINKEPKSAEIEDDAVFAFNSEFVHKLYRIKVNSIQLKETVEENQSTTEKVFADRQFQVDAAIVRIMKARKQLVHQELMAEVFNQLKFPLKGADVKKRIESLIEREYLERDKENKNMFHYLA